LSPQSPHLLKDSSERGGALFPELSQAWKYMDESVNSYDDRTSKEIDIKQSKKQTIKTACFNCYLLMTGNTPAGHRKITCFLSGEKELKIPFSTYASSF
jgi:hypothetical protein